MAEIKNAENDVIRKITLTTGALIILALVSSAAAWSMTTITVNSLNGFGSAGTCVLGEAILVANKGGGTINGCSAGADTAYTIQFESGLSGSIIVDNHLPMITGNITIIGPTGSPGITIEGNGSAQPFNLNVGASLNLQNLTIADGFGGLGGGAIYNAVGTVTVTNCAFLNNSLAEGEGRRNLQPERHCNGDQQHLLG